MRTPFLKLQERTTPSPAQQSLCRSLPRHRRPLPKSTALLHCFASVHRSASIPTSDWYATPSPVPTFFSRFRPGARVAHLSYLAPSTRRPSSSTQSAAVANHRTFIQESFLDQIISAFAVHHPLWVRRAPLDRTSCEPLCHTTLHRGVPSCVAATIAVRHVLEAGVAALTLRGPRMHLAYTCRHPLTHAHSIQRRVSDRPYACVSVAAYLGRIKPRRTDECGA